MSGIPSVLCRKIFSELRAVEQSQQHKLVCLPPGVRVVAIDFLFSLAAKCGFAYATAYLAVSLMERDLAITARSGSEPSIEPSLVVACLLIAAKLDDPSEKVRGRKIVAAACAMDLPVTLQDVEAAEVRVVTAAKFDLLLVTPATSVDWFANAASEGLGAEHMDAYVDMITELLAVMVNASDVLPPALPSLRAAAAVYGARRAMARKQGGGYSAEPWLSTLKAESQFDEAEMACVADAALAILDR